MRLFLCVTACDVVTNVAKTSRRRAYVYIGDW